MAYNTRLTEGDARSTLQQREPFWDKLFSAEQARIVVLLVERVDIGTDDLPSGPRRRHPARAMLAGDMGAAV